MNLALLTELLSSTIRITTPIMLMALGGMLCERANVFNIALEGMALVGAFFAVAFVSFTGGSVWMGLLGGILAGCIYSALFALVITRFRANHIIASMPRPLRNYGKRKPIFSVIRWTGSTMPPGR